MLPVNKLIKIFLKVTPCAIVPAIFSNVIFSLSVYLDIKVVTITLLPVVVNKPKHIASEMKEIMVNIIIIILVRINIFYNIGKYKENFRSLGVSSQKLYNFKEES